MYFVQALSGGVTVKSLKKPLHEVQKALDNNPADSNLRDEEAIYLKAFNEAKLDEEGQNQRSRIEMVLDANNVEVSGPNIPDIFVSHYEMFLGTSMRCDDLNVDGLFTKMISDEVCSNMVTTVTNLEIKEAMFGIGGDICNAVRDFFSNGKLLKEINHTFIALIPKISTPQRVNDYRPISCCNVLYKCISKILTNRIITGIKEVVSENQSAFVPGRRIADNILITQELMHNYHRDRGPPRCAFKIDIQKAYDTVDWRFLANILKCLGFHPTMIKWIMTCIKSSSFSVSLNGDILGFFKGKRGLRQGDPLSPYLFTLVMEVLILIIRRRVRLSETFRYHNHCEELQLVNVCFADNLFIFARGDVDSARVIMESLDEFKSTSGLVLSLPKSTAFFCNVCNHVKIAILNIMQFSEGKLPVKYLGVPLISSKLLIMDCKVLVEKATNRIGRSFWDIPLKADISWGWRKILKLRDTIWPHVWLLKAPNIGTIPTPNLANHVLDVTRWCDANGNMLEFSVRNVWEALRDHGNEVPWHHLVWFPHCNGYVKMDKNKANRTKPSMGLEECKEIEDEGIFSCIQ
ncbi:protein LAZ1 [Tanacetum coccineum]